MRHPAFGFSKFYLPGQPSIQFHDKRRFCIPLDLCVFAVYVNKSKRLEAVRTFSPVLIREAADQIDLTANRAIEGNIIASPVLKMAEGIFIQFSRMLHFFAFLMRWQSTFYSVKTRHRIGPWPAIGR